MKALIPERFGCGSKLALSDVRKLKGEILPFRPSGDAYDAALYTGLGGRIASSIDKVYDLALDPVSFANVALLHCSRDLLAVGAYPERCDVAFEFGVEMTASDRSVFTSAVCRTLAESGIQLGKIHSSTAFTTSVTLALSGPTSVDFFKDAPTSGTLVLSDKIGKLRGFYECGLRGGSTPSWLQFNTWPEYDAISRQLIPQIVDWTDISGFGLIGSLIALSDKHVCETLISCEIESIFTSMEPVPDCLQSDVRGLDIPVGIDSNSAPFFALREVCGPMVCMVPDHNVHNVISIFSDFGLSPSLLGRYKPNE